MWYSKENDIQGLVIDEKTGITIAVTYDKKHAKMISLTPKLIKAIERFFAAEDSDEHHHAMVNMEEVLNEATY